MHATPPMSAPDSDALQTQAPRRRLLTDDKFDIFGALHFLFTCEQRSVRDDLVRLLYDFPLDAIDFVLPQLCVLFSLLRAEDSGSLEAFLVECCSRSIHFGVRLVLLVSAEAAFCSGAPQTRLLRLLEAAEMAVVNSKVTAADLVQHLPPEASRNRTNGTSESSAKPSSPSLRVRTSSSGGGAAASSNDTPLSPLSPTSPPAAVRAAEEETIKTQQEKIEQRKQQIIRASRSRANSAESSPSAGRVPVGLPGEGQMEAMPALPAAASASAAGPSALSAALIREDQEELAPDDPAAQVFDVFVAKQIRSEYFNAELSLITALDRLSAALVKVPRVSRRDYLREYLGILNGSVIRGLYFPLGSMSSPHYEILNVFTDAGVALNSRDKAPFLMLVEMRRTGRPCGARDIHRVFRYEDVTQRRMQAEPKYTPYEMHSGKVKLSSSPLDEHVKASYFTPEAEFVNKRELPAAPHPVGLELGGDESGDESVWVDVNAPTSEEIVKYNEPRAAKGVVLDRSVCEEAARCAFGELWAEKRERLRKQSPYGHLPGWDLVSVIFKGGDDCRQELLAMQLIYLFDDIFRSAQIPLRLRPYDVFVTSSDSGIIETIPNAHSVHTIKSEVLGFTTLATFFEHRFGKDTGEFFEAQRNFTESMAAYSLVTYLLQIKDRHNGNIMLLADGSIVHIDFGFMFSNSPGGNINFESAPFKLTREYIEVMDGEDSDSFHYFKTLFYNGFIEARKHAHKFLRLVEVMYHGSDLQCFIGGRAAVDAFRDRFVLGMSDPEVIAHCMQLIEQSVDDFNTNQYDYYQRTTNGIL